MTNVIDVFISSRLTASRLRALSLLMVAMAVAMAMLTTQSLGYDITFDSNAGVHRLMCVDQSGGVQTTIPGDPITPFFDKGGVNTGAIFSLHVDLSACNGLANLARHPFSGLVNLRRLTIVGPRSSDMLASTSSGSGSVMARRDLIPDQLFAGLRGLERLSVDGFEVIADALPEDLFEPLSELRELQLSGFARHNLTVRGLSRLIRRLTRLEGLRLDSPFSSTDEIDLDALFDGTQHLGLRRLDIVGDGTTLVSGRLSKATPSLEELHIELTANLYPGTIEIAIDTVMLHRSLCFIKVTNRIPPKLTEALKEIDELDGNCALPFALCSISRSTNSTAERAVNDLHLAAIMRAFGDAMSAAKSISQYANRTPDGDECFRGFILPVSVRLIETMSIGIKYDWLDTDDSTYCLDPSNTFEKATYKDYLSRDAVLNWTVRGLDRLRSLDVEGGRLLYISPRTLKYLPSLTELRFVNNFPERGSGPFSKFPSIGNSFAINETGRSGSPLEEPANEAGFFANNPHLRLINLSRNKIEYLPSSFFNGLAHLEHVDLSGNQLSVVNFRFHGVKRLRSLFLTDNHIRVIGDQMRAAIDEMFQTGRGFDGGSFNLTVDLSGTTPLSCDCYSLEFVEWMHQAVADERSSIRFINYSTYSCKMPNGRVERLAQVDVSKLRDDCSAVSFVNGSDCPCDSNDRRRLEAIRLNLAGKYCRIPPYSSSELHLLPLDSVAVHTTQLPFACQLFRGWSIALLTVAISLVVVLVVLLTAVLVAYHTQRLVCRRSDIKAVIKHYFRLIWKYSGDRDDDDDGYVEEDRLFDAFLVCHEDDRKFSNTVAVGLSKHLGLAVGNEDDLLAGCYRLEGLIEAFNRTDYIVLVLSDSFINCNFFDLVMNECVMRRLRKVILITERTENEVTISASRSSLRYTYRKAIAFCPIIEWTTKDESVFWNKLRQIILRRDRATLGRRRSGNERGRLIDRLPVISGTVLSITDYRHRGKGLRKSSTCPRFDTQ